MAAPGRDTVKCGGNTSCIEIESGPTRIICCAGTGIRSLGLDLIRRTKGRAIRAHIILSHLHWDHYIGLPFFRPLYDKANHFVIAGPRAGRLEFGAALAKVINPPYFPIPFSKIPSDVVFRTLSEGRFRIGNVRVSAMEVNHPGGSLGWRFFFPNGRSLVHVTDNEPLLGMRLHRFIRWMKGADILIHDSQYGPENYKGHRGWGHSPYTYPLMLASQARIKRLFLFHFDPAATDRQMKEVIAAARRFARASRPRFLCELAREGLSVRL